MKYMKLDQRLGSLFLRRSTDSLVHGDAVATIHTNVIKVATKQKSTKDKEKSRNKLSKNYIKLNVRGGGPGERDSLGNNQRQQWK